MTSEIKKLESSLWAIEKQWRAMYYGTIGAVAGFLASLIMMGADIVSARMMGFAPFILLRYYETLREGPTALLMTSWTFFLNAVLMHLALGSAFGAIFVLIVSGRKKFQQFSRYVAAGIVFGLAIWIFNFYFLFSWIQPLINGKEYILDNIPWWIAAGTHAVFGLSVALVSYPFRNDVEQE
jgi:hypothetical protein